MAFGDRVIQKDLTFDIPRSRIFVVMGGSGCGKSTLMRHLVGLQEPAAGSVMYGAVDFWKGEDEDREAIRRRIGILYQSGALWSSLTLAENIAIPIRTFTDFGEADIRDLVSYKLALVGLAGFEDYYPSEISGGMRKRAALARAMALDPDILFFDEPSAGLDPLTSARLDQLILQLRDTLGSTVVIITHELSSIFAIGDDAIFLDAGSKTMIARGHPRDLRDHADDPGVRRFLNRETGENAP